MTETEGGAGDGNVFEGFEDQAVDSFRAADRQAEAVDAIDGANIRAAVDQEAAILLRIDIARINLRIGGEFTDHFFK